MRLFMWRKIETVNLYCIVDERKMIEENQYIFVIEKYLRLINNFKGFNHKPGQSTKYYART